MDISNEEKKKKKINKLLDVLLVFFIVVFLVSGFFLARYIYNIKKSESAFAEVEGLIAKETPTSDTTPKGKKIIEKNGTYYVEQEDGEDTFYKYDDLYEANHDFIGWLHIDDTPIDYPVMYTPQDDEFYLRKDFNKQYSLSGTLFIDGRDKIANPSDNIIIYGHHMKSGTMFGSLQKYESQDYYESHKLIHFDTLYEEGTYEVIAAFKTQIYDEGYTGFVVYDFINALDREDFDYFVANCKELSSINASATASYGDKLITLTTCAYHVDNGRFVVIAKKVK